MTPRTGDTTGLWMLTVPASGVQPGDVLAMDGFWCTAARNDDAPGGEASRRLLLEGMDGWTRTRDVPAAQDTAVLRRVGPAPEAPVAEPGSAVRRYLTGGD